MKLFLFVLGTFSIPAERIEDDILHKQTELVDFIFKHHAILEEQWKPLVRAHSSNGLTCEHSHRSCTAQSREDRRHPHAAAHQRWRQAAHRSEPLQRGPSHLLR